MTTTICIPARIESTRLPRKMLAEINGKPLILLMLEKALKSKADLAYVVTGSQEIANLIPDEYLAYDPIRSSSGTAHIADAVQKELVVGDVIINLQGDEPMFELDNINIFIDFARYYEQDRCTAVKRGIGNKGGVGVWLKDGWAVDFQRNNDWSYKHIGIYSYPREFLLNYKQPDRLDLEQDGFLPLRAIEMISMSIGVDTPDDLRRVRSKLKG